MSCVTKGLSTLLRIKHLRTSVYHPQTDGLVERFNKTLKAMLRKSIERDGCNWDQLLPYLMSAIREVPHASTGFSSFELLYSHKPRGLLYLAKEAWEKQPCPHCTVIEHVEAIEAQGGHHLPHCQRTYGKSSKRTASILQPARVPARGPGCGTGTHC